MNRCNIAKLPYVQIDYGYSVKWLYLVIATAFYVKKHLHIHAEKNIDMKKGTIFCIKKHHFPIKKKTLHLHMKIKAPRTVTKSTYTFLS